MFRTIGDFLIALIIVSIIGVGLIIAPFLGAIGIFVLGVLFVMTAIQIQREENESE